MPARLERREAVRLDETRRAELTLERDDGRIEAFEVTHLQDATTRAAVATSSRASSSVSGDRLFDEHVDAVLEAAHGDRVVQRRGRRDADRIDLAEQLAKSATGRQPASPATRSRVAAVGIDHGDQLRRRRHWAYFWAWKRPRYPTPMTAVHALTSRA